MAICEQQHARYDPPIAEFNCPKCGAKAGDLCVDEPVGGWDDPDHAECEKLHDKDQLTCLKCNYRTTGKALAALLMKKRNLVPCPHCKGKGVVPKGKGESK